MLSFGDLTSLGHFWNLPSPCFLLGLVQRQVICLQRELFFGVVSLILSAGAFGQRETPGFSRGSLPLLVCWRKGHLVFFSVGQPTCWKLWAVIFPLGFLIGKILCLDSLLRVVCTFCACSSINKIFLYWSLKKKEKDPASGPDSSCPINVPLIKLVFLIK